MAFPDVEAVRAESAHHLKTRWKPVDLVCEFRGDQVTVRTKLARDPESLAVCIAEAVSHAFLAACGFRVAEGFFVKVGPEFAQDLTAQYQFDSAVQEGRHWGTRYMQRDVLEVEFVPELVSKLHRPAELMELYLADVVLANPDRATFGNVLLAHRPSSTQFDLLPIDQSDSFFHPSTLLSETMLRSRFDDSGAEMLAGTERALQTGGPEIVESAFSRIAASQGRTSGFVEEAAEEWFFRAGIDPGPVVEFLEHRLEALDVLGQKDHWLGLSKFGGGGNTLELNV